MSFSAINGVMCPALSLTNSDVSSSNNVLPGSQVDLVCSEGHEFGATHDSDVVRANCLHTAAWNIDTSQYECQGEKSPPPPPQNQAYLMLS